MMKVMGMLNLMLRGFLLLCGFLFHTGCFFSNHNPYGLLPRGDRSIYDVNKASYASGVEPLAHSPAYRARVHTNLASAYYSEGQHGIALEELRRALLADRKYPQAHSMLGVVYSHLGDNHAALQSFRRSVQLSPGDPEVLNNYAWFICSRDGDTDESYQEGMRLAQRAASNSLYGTPEKAWDNAGHCAEHLHLDDEAVASYEKSYRLYRNYSALMSVVRSYLRLKLPLQAKALLDDWMLHISNGLTEDVLLYAIETEEMLGNILMQEKFKLQLVQLREKKLEQQHSVTDR